MAETQNAALPPPPALWLSLRLRGPTRGSTARSAQAAQASATQAGVPSWPGLLGNGVTPSSLEGGCGNVMRSQGKTKHRTPDREGNDVTNMCQMLLSTLYVYYEADPHNNRTLSPFYRWGNRGTERLAAPSPDLRAHPRNQHTLLPPQMRSSGTSPPPRDP